MSQGNNFRIPLRQKHNFGCWCGCENTLLNKKSVLKDKNSAIGNKNNCAQYRNTFPFHPIGTAR